MLNHRRRTSARRGEIRELADRQAQAATSFREAIRHSLSIDAGGSENDSAMSTRSSPFSEDLRDTPAEAGDVSYGQAAGQQLAENLDELPPARGKEDGDASNQAYRGNDEKAAELPGGALRTAVDIDADGASAPSDASSNTAGGAALVLASNMCRLASRQGDAANELLRASPSAAARWTALGPVRRGPRKVPEALEAVVALGRAVGLQAKAVGLMEEVVERAKHSRVSHDARKEKCYWYQLW